VDPSRPEKPKGLREFTPRSVAVGLLVALVIGASYPYVVLKFGFGPNISVVSAFFGFLALGLFSKSYNRWENNIVQTAGTAAGQIAFLVWLLAAFDLLAAEKGSGFDVHLTTFQSFAWLSASGLLGVFLAIPLRKHFIVDEKLPFADGMAAGETLIMLDGRGAEARRSAFLMLGSLAASGIVFSATTYHKLAEIIPLRLNAFSDKVKVGFGLSLLNVGSGMIIGIRICASMLVGTLLAWVIGPQWLLGQGLIKESSSRTEVLLLVMWPAVGLLIAGGITALLLRWRVLGQTFKSLAAASVETGDLSLRWVWIGSLVSAFLLIVLQLHFFGTPIWHSVLAILLSIPLALVALRVLGETNWGPISTMTNLSQAFFGAVAPGDLRASMVTSGITGSVAAESEGLIQDYKAGDMIGSTPKVLTYMQLLAVPVGALALAFMYPQLKETYGIGGDKGLSSPISTRWVGFAKIVTRDLSGPGSAGPEAAARLHWMTTSFVIGALVGIVLTLLEQRPSWRTFVPSPTGMGTGMIIPAFAVTSMFLGALADWIWQKSSSASHRSYSVPVAAGFIAGEALVAVIIPLLVMANVLGLPPQ
jgi:putative OPT family oligopeptide transporter